MHNLYTILADAAQGGGSAWGGLLMPVILIALFYFMFLRPQQRKEKERRQMIDELRAGAKIVFAGGIVGTIASATEKTFTVDTLDGRMVILRSCVQGTVTDDALADTPKEEAKK
ncbi:MAG: preprotein translocase subunit YajC [Kiritimatiellae bacterium]|nr:preprotein translocase subunit YajC [Kiritimatiellia bacterium]